MRFMLVGMYTASATESPTLKKSETIEYLEKLCKNPFNPTRVFL